MTTLPFGNSILDKIKAREQASTWFLTLREVVQFRSYCCNIDSDSIMGIKKQPVIIMDLDPDRICLGKKMDWDISDSYAPGSTLTSWSVDFGDGSTPESGSNFPSDATSGEYEYLELGKFVITVTIEEGTGLSQTSLFYVEVIDCHIFSTIAYCGTSGDGVFKIDFDDPSPEWNPINNGLYDHSLNIRSLVPDPGISHKRSSLHRLKIATKGGVFFSSNGGASWDKIIMPDPSNLEFNDTPPATVDELDWLHIVLDPKDKNIIYVLAAKEDF